MKSRLYVLSLALTFVLANSAAAPANAQTSATEKKHSAHQPRPREPEYIACAKRGCQPTPPGCHPEIGFYPEGTPTGYNVIVCPRRP